MIRKIAERGIMKKNAHRSYFHLGKHSGGFFLSDRRYVSYEGGLKQGRNHLGNDPSEGSNTVDSCIGSAPPGEENKIVVHQKYKVQVALCIDRFPLTFEQEEFEKDFEDFKDKWLQKTNNNLNIDEEFLHMKYNLSSFHDRKKENHIESANLEDEMGHQKGKKDKGVNHLPGEEATSAESDDLENLFAIEGIQNILSEKEKKKKKKNDGDANEEKKKKHDDDHESEYNYTSVMRKPNHFLYLVVKYKKTNKWMFPLMDFKKKLTIRQNLQHLCTEHLKCEMPFFIGYCPCTFEKRKYKIPLSFNEIIGRKIFYYRAHYLNHGVNLDLSNNEHINDFAWLSRSELKDFLSSSKYQVIKDALPLT
ncbi:mitochondrial ribosomal protein L46 precursor, putative [Plasmodium vivax]|uniref:Mitochondrial ribosomal protein L46 n=5 Tax=Plasmodium vivax TaxID=5855 RepID=A5K2A1_PLAVS|nr:hypothetical protein, conserved [Plasmodium vivax]EDL46551.1 hypothetical protein, conserved [Plasmodium vivax]CAG9477812.1 unnamed protein product [Plasmodium vivax]SCO68128.1 mitochondrial ribosomal protein L46 precursor, putative [Plasmodium vivax]SCO73593.1 mitochondrial ribosomal protein L46 precursor, putative [Plasmodium vivax]VUZ96974.1 ribosomal protein L46, mitochondrial, putative [Plasmodium vivax]|eukprot:XP_001616278.1 hypothetical protein [Plasmodium vivax Sal-1]